MERVGERLNGGETGERGREREALIIAGESRANDWAYVRRIYNWLARSRSPTIFVSLCEGVMRFHPDSEISRLTYDFDDELSATAPVNK